MHLIRVKIPLENSPLDRLIAVPNSAKLPEIRGNGVVCFSQTPVETAAERKFVKIFCILFELFRHSTFEFETVGKIYKTLLQRHVTYTKINQTFELLDEKLPVVLITRISNHLLASIGCLE